MSTVSQPYRDEHGRTLADYPRPSVAVDTAVLTVAWDMLWVLLVHSRAGEQRLPGTFLHEGETLERAVRRSLRDKAGVRANNPQQLHVFDDPRRDDRGRPFAAGVAYFLLWAVCRYVDLFSDFGGMLGAALVFLACGCALVGAAWLWRRLKEAHHVHA